MSASCEACRFRSRVVDRYSGMADCHRYPPSNKPHPNGGVMASWPKVSDRDWCGEYQANHTQGEG